MIDELLKSFENEIESSIQVDEDQKEIVFNSIKIDMLSGAKGVLENLSKNESFIDGSTNESLEIIGQYISHIDDAIDGLVQEISLED